MLLFLLITLAAVLLGLFAFLAYGSILDSSRHFFTVLTFLFLVWVLILGARLTFQEWGSGTDSTPTSTASVSPEAPARLAPSVAPPAASVATPAVLPPLVHEGSSFHLDPGQSSPLFRIPTGKKARVSIFSGSVTLYSGGVAKLSCERRPFWISGRGDADQLVACDRVVDVVIDQLSD